MQTCAQQCTMHGIQSLKDTCTGVAPLTAHTLLADTCAGMHHVFALIPPSHAHNSLGYLSTVFETRHEGPDLLEDEAFGRIWIFWLGYTLHSELRHVRPLSY